MGVSVMDVSEYIEAVTGQMRCKRARTMVAKELSDHIEDQTEAYLGEGMSPEDAQAEAVRQMGDAVEVGTEMDLIHRPRMDKHTLILIVILSVVACIVQTIIIGAQKNGGNQFVSRKWVPLQVLLGLIIMVAILYWDYTRLEKHAVLLWLAIFMLPWLCQEFHVPGIGYYLSWRLNLYSMMALAPPVYAALVYHYRKKKWSGILFSILWLAAGSLIYRGNAQSTFQVLTMIFICLFVLSYAIAKGWYGVRRIPALCTLWGILLGGCLAFIGYIFTFGLEYQKSRLRIFLQFWSKDTEREINYISESIRVSLERISLWGRGSGWEPGGVMELSSDMSFYIILNRIGLIPCVLIVFGLLALSVCMAAGVSRQKNVLGGLVGVACMMGLLTPAVLHVLGNVAVLPYSTVLMPFVYPGWLSNAVSYTLLGFYLSVYRNTDVVATDMKM